METSTIGMSDRRGTIEEILTLIKAEMGVPVDLAPDQSIFQSGLLDSIDLVEMIMLVERHYGIAIDPKTISLDNFDTVERIAKLVR